MANAKNQPSIDASKNREDFSRFVVHLTRDDRKSFGSGGATARTNLLTILKERQIRSFSPHCLFNNKLAGMPASLLRGFNVACFTETPLNHLRELVREIPGRQVKFEAYGLVFLREFIVSSGGQPAIYINSYSDNSWLRDGVNELFELATKSEPINNKLFRLLPFINAMHEKYDFSWEREWRILGSLRFTYKDLVCVILPETGEDKLREVMAIGGIAAIAPNWTYEHIVAELSKQQRATKSYLDAKLKELAPTTTTSKNNTEESSTG
jgi:hypothetical protein